MKNYLLGIAFIFVVVIPGCKKETLGVTLLSNPTEGEILVSPYDADLSGSGTLMILDKDGNVIKEKITTTAALNFNKWEVDGKVRYTYLQYDPNAPKITENSIVPCYGVVLDENLNELKRITLLPYNGRTTSELSAIDSHEFIYLGDDHFITLSYYQKTVTNIPETLNPVFNCKVVVPIIQEIVNDQVVWEWEADNYPELYEQSVEGNDFSNAGVVHDYIHMNSIIVDPTDNNLICSMRNENKIVKIDRQSGNIMWRLGGANSDFPMTADMKFLRQHHVTLTDNNQTLLVFDNGEATERPYTRIDEFQLNADTKTVSSFKTFTLPEGIFAQYMGSVQKRGDTYFIGCGSVPKALEVNYTTNVISFLMNLPDVSYRAYKY